MTRSTRWTDDCFFANRRRYERLLYVVMQLLMSTTRNFVVIALGTLLFTPPASATNSQRPSHVSERRVGNTLFRVFDSGSFVYHPGSHLPGIFWINNEEVLFIALEYKSQSNRRDVTFQIRKWNTRTNANHLLRTIGPDRPILCFFEGQVFIRVQREGGQIEQYQGPLGAEKPADPAEIYDRRLCRRIDKLPTLPQWTAGHEIRWLENLDAGFVDFGMQQQVDYSAQLRLYKHNAQPNDGVTLPFLRGTTAPRFPFYRFKTAFFVETDYHIHPAPRDRPYPVYWLYADGRVEKIADIPWGPWRSRASFSVVPTKAGLLMGSSNVRAERDLGHAGLYLLKNSNVIQVLSAWIDGHGVAVSPSGCRAAFAYAPFMTAKMTILQVIELCDGGQG